ncbi:glycerophosphodiester phosphodiesterase [Paenibacillus sp. IITD108]|uniref:glycerophosphodiester phosphodiesterase n=1 Tax=Paenibacillus sp. IITD108 TaxID=3116649 RepID=UPI002F416802
MKKPIIFAHRGASGYCPENTMAAFVKALEMGATGIETDLQMTQDGQLVLMHDEYLTRTAGLNKLLAHTTWEEVQTLDAGSWFHPDFSGERVPSLEALLELTKGTEIIINIELKNGFVQYPDLESKMIELIHRYGMEKQIILSSFNHYSLFLCHQLAPDIKTGILYMEGLYEPWKYAKSLGATALHAPKYAVLPEWVAQAKEHQVVYHPFTVNDEAEMQSLLQAGVAGIITDYPDRLANIIAKQSEG